MGVIDGWKQTTLYANGKVMRVLKGLAAMRDIPLYRLVDEALREKIERDLTPAQRKAYGYERAKKAKRTDLSSTS